MRFAGDRRGDSSVAEETMKRVQTYAAQGIQVTFDPNVCIHSAVCLKALPAVFDVRRRQWVEAGAASVAEVVAAIDRCPSGALQYVLPEPDSGKG